MLVQYQKTKSKFPDTRRLIFNVAPATSESGSNPETTNLPDKKLDAVLEISKIAKKRISDTNTEIRKSGVEIKEETEKELDQYFKNNIDRFDTDKNGKITVGEIKAYQEEMTAKIEEIIKESKPDQATKDAHENMKKAGESAAKAPAEAATPLGEVQALTDTMNIGQSLAAFQTLQTQTQSFQSSANEQMKSVQEFQGKLITFEQSKQGFKSSMKRLGNRLNPFTPNDDQAEVTRLESALSSLKANVSTKLDELKAKKATLDANAQKINEAIAKERERLMKERDDKIKELEAKKAAKAENVKEQLAKKEQLKEQIAKTQARRDALGKKVANQDDFRKKWEEDNRTNKYGDQKKGLDEVSEDNQIIVANLDILLQNPNISPEQRAAIVKEKSAALDRQKRSKAASGLMDKKLQGNQVLDAQLSEDEKKAKDELSSADKHLTGTLNPTLSSLDSSISELEKLKLQYATESKEVADHYNKRVDNVNDISKQVSEGTLRGALSRNRTIDSLQSTLTSLNSIKIEAPGFLKAVVAPVQSGLHAIGEGLGSLAKSIDRNSSTAINLTDSTFGKVLLNIVAVPAGFLSGGLEMFGGIATMAAHPLQTAEGLGSLLGRNPKTGELFHWETFSDTWSHMFSALTGFGEMKQGNIGGGAGKLAFNVLSMFVGAGEAGAAAKAGAASKLARTAAIDTIKLAGKEMGYVSKLRVFGAESGAFFKTLGVEGAKGAIETVKSLPGGVAKGASNMKNGLVDGLAGKSAAHLGPETSLAYRATASVGEGLRFAVKHPGEAAKITAIAPFKALAAGGNLLLVRPIKAIARTVSEIPQLARRIKTEGFFNMMRAADAAEATSVLAKDGTTYSKVKGDAAKIVSEDAELSRLSAQGPEGAKLAETKALQQLSKTHPEEIAAYLRVEEAANVLHEASTAMAKESFDAAKKIKAEPAIAKAGQEYEIAKATAEKPAATPAEKAAKAKAEESLKAMEADKSIMENVQKYQEADKVEKAVIGLMEEQKQLLGEYTATPKESLLKMEAEVAEARNPTITAKPEYFKNSLAKYEEAILSGDAKAVEEASKAFGKVEKGSEMAKELGLVEQRAKVKKTIEDFKSSQKGKTPDLFKEAESAVAKGDQGILDFTAKYPEHSDVIATMKRQSEYVEGLQSYRKLAKENPEFKKMHVELDEALRRGDLEKVNQLKMTEPGSLYLDQIKAYEYSFKTNPSTAPQNLQNTFTRQQKAFVKDIEAYQLASADGKFAEAKKIADAHPEYAEAFKQLETRNNYLAKDSEITYRLAAQRVKVEAPGLLEAKMTPQQAADKLALRYDKQPMGGSTAAGKAEVVQEGVILQDGKKYKIQLETAGEPRVRLISEETGQAIKTSREVAAAEKIAEDAAKAAKTKPVAATDTIATKPGSTPETAKVLSEAELEKAKKIIQEKQAKISELEDQIAVGKGDKAAQEKAIKTLKEEVAELEPKISATEKAAAEQMKLAQEITKMEGELKNLQESGQYKDVKRLEQELPKIEKDLEEAQRLFEEKYQKNKEHRIAVGEDVKLLETRLDEYKNASNEYYKSLAKQKAQEREIAALESSSPVAGTPEYQQLQKLKAEHQILSTETTKLEKVSNDLYKLYVGNRDLFDATKILVEQQQKFNQVKTQLEAAQKGKAYLDAVKTEQELSKLRSQTKSSPAGTIPADPVAPKTAKPIESTPEPFPSSAVDSSKPSPAKAAREAYKAELDTAKKAVSEKKDSLRVADQELKAAKSALDDARKELDKGHKKYGTDESSALKEIDANFDKAQKAFDAAKEKQINAKIELDEARTVLDEKASEPSRKYYQAKRDLNEVHYQAAEARKDFQKAKIDFDLAKEKWEAAKKENNPNLATIEAEYKLAEDVYHKADVRNFDYNKTYLPVAEQAFKEATELNSSQIVNDIREAFTKERQLPEINLQFDALKKYSGQFKEWATEIFDALKEEQAVAKSPSLSSKLFSEASFKVSRSLERLWERLNGKEDPIGPIYDKILNVQLLKIAQISKVMVANYDAIKALSTPQKLQMINEGLKRVAGLDQQPVDYNDVQLKYAGETQDTVRNAIPKLYDASINTPANIIALLNKELGAEVQNTGRAYSFNIDGITINIDEKGKRTYEGVEKWLELKPAKAQVGDVYRDFANNYSKIYSKKAIAAQEKMSGGKLTLDQYRASVLATMTDQVKSKIGDKKGFQVFSKSRVDSDHANFITSVDETGGVNVQINDQWLEKTFEEVTGRKPVSAAPTEPKTDVGAPDKKTAPVTDPKSAPSAAPKAPDAKPTDLPVASKDAKNNPYAA